MGATALVAGPPELAPLVINATSDGGAVAAAVHTASAGGWCVDLQYKPVETPFVRAARAAGRNALSGSVMLVAQAIAKFRIWFGDDVEKALVAEQHGHRAGSRRRAREIGREIVCVRDGLERPVADAAQHLGVGRSAPANR